MTKERIIGFTFLAIIAPVILTIILCNSYIGLRKKHLEEKNPTSYVFHMQLTELRGRILKDFTKSRLSSKNDLFSVQEISIKRWDIYTRDNFVDIEPYSSIFTKTENYFDLYLYSGSQPTVSYSKVYKKFRKSLKYSAQFQLHFTSINENDTKIEVITHNPEVLYFSFPVFSGHSYVNFKKVEPTTIEEYEILLRIGNLTGEKDMPFLKLPS